jgi:hypothetical protein
VGADSVDRNLDTYSNNRTSLRVVQPVFVGLVIALALSFVQCKANAESRIEYRRRSPEGGVLYKVLQENVNTFFDRVDSDPNKTGLPFHVKKELLDYLDCGVLARGFIRVYCESCSRNQLVALSCKHRGFCPSCGGRRMRERSLHLVERVFPQVPIRQWVFSVPISVRYLLAYRPEILTEVLSIYVGTISGFIKKQARENGFRKVHTGSVTVIQRAGSALNLNIHLHGLFLDGYFARDASGHLQFHKIKAPTNEEMGKLVGRMKDKVHRKLRRLGLFEDSQDEGTTFENFLAASVRYRTVTGERAGQRLRMLGSDPCKEIEFELRGKRCAAIDGFSLHANTRIGAKNRIGLEKMCAYISRPPLSSERLSRRANGDLLLRLKQPFADGSTYILFEPMELVEKLAALVPPRWANLARYHGCFAPRSKVRREIVPDTSDKSRIAYSKWSEILKRSFGIDIFQCSFCGGKTRVTAAILEGDSVKAILKSLGLPTEAPEPYPARASPQEEFSWGA